MADFEILKLYADAGYHLTPLKGKIPQKKDWTKTPFLASPNPEDFPENFGVVLQETDLVVDCDPRNYKDGVNSFQKLQANLKWKLKETTTPIVRTGGGGMHIYLKKPAGLVIYAGLSDYPGVEFKTKGTQVVGARCTHPETKMFYNLVNGNFKIGSIPQAPANLLELIAKPTTAVAPAAALAPVVTSSDDQTKMRFAEYCRVAEPAVQGQNGDKTTFTVACYGRDLGLPDHVTVEIMAQQYNPKCLPPWPLEELATKVLNAYRYGKNVQGNLSPAADFPEVIQPENKNKIRWDVTETGQKKKTLNNCVNYFIDPLSELSTLVAWDEFTDQVMLVEKAPWHHPDQTIPKDGLPWTDEDTIQCRYHLSRVKKFDAQSELIVAAVINAASQRRNHPVRNYLNALVWDKKPRLDSWLAEYCGVNDSPYSKAVGSKTILGAVARVFQPGVKFDYMLVLEGDQGTGKSSVCAALGGPWYGDLHINPHDKDTIASMKGKWIVEASEMDFTTRAEAQAQKAFLSRQADTQRAAYARMAKTVQRQCVFIGTMNVEAGMGYLKDTTGNRRFWPVKTEKISIPKLKRDRDQLFAEALFRYRAGETLYIDDHAVEKMARKEQAARRMVDPWLDKISSWLQEDQFGLERQIVTAMDIWVDCLQGIEKQLDRRNQIRISQIMCTELRWDHGNAWSATHKKVVKGYRRPEVVATVPVS